MAQALTNQVVETIIKDDLTDPIAKQYLRDSQEDIVHPYESTDPIGDDKHTASKGLVHRYSDRVLLKITDICSVYCRFCFRKDSVGKGEGILTSEELDAALSYIKATPQIKEVILSGGDPLTLSNRRLSELLAQLEDIEHLDIVRFHTRTPMVKPERVDSEFIEIINNYSKAIYMVTHVNHAQEINQAVIEAFDKVNQSRIVHLSQSVLLKGVNDNIEALEGLFRKLIKHSVKPYYLHHLDLAEGTSHFRVSISKGQNLMQQLRGRISGIAMPTYVLDIPGGFNKVPLEKSYIQTMKNNKHCIKDIQGQEHIYQDIEVESK